MGHKAKEIKRNVEKMKAQLVEMMGFPKGIVEEAKNISNTQVRTPSTRRSARTYTHSLVVAKSSKTKFAVGLQRKESSNTPTKQQSVLQKRRKEKERREQYVCVSVDEQEEEEEGPQLVWKRKTSLSSRDKYKKSKCWHCRHR